MSSAVQRYWEDGDGPVVHIYGACSHEGLDDARAGYATDWGPEDSRNKAGAVFGLKTQLRAELTALRAALETAIENAIDMLVIRHRSDGIASELENWSNKSAHREHFSPNKDLLRVVDCLRSEIQVRIELADTRETIGFKNIMLMAKRIAGLHSTAALPVTDEHWEEGTRIVDISGYKAELLNEEICAFGVFWGPNDKRNFKGRAFGRQEKPRAELTALRLALETAKDEGFDEIIIRSRDIDTHKLLNLRRRSDMKRNKDLLRGNVFLLQSFTSVFHLLPPESMNVPGLIEAERLAKEYCNDYENSVGIYGIGTADKNGIATFGIAWAVTNERNESGWVAGAHGDFCAELAALERALILSESRDYLNVYTNSDYLIMFVNESRHEWKRRNWLTRSGTDAPCMEMCKSVDRLLDKRKIRITRSTNKCVREARKLAESANHCLVVHTAGVLLDGNNENSAMYGIFWDSNDEKNETGRVPGIQSSVRAQLWAIRRAVEIALENGIKKLLICTDYRPKDGDDIILKMEIRRLRERIEHLEYKRSKSDEARKLAISSIM